MAASDEQETGDTTALSNSLVMPSAGDTVTVYATADESFTTVDTSSGTAGDIPGDNTANYLLTFTTDGTPQLTGYVDADSETAYSDALDGPAETTPAPVATDSFGNLVTGTDSTSAPCIDDPGGGLARAETITAPTCSLKSPGRWTIPCREPGNIIMESSTTTALISPRARWRSAAASLRMSLHPGTSYLRSLTKRTTRAEASTASITPG